MYVWPASHYCSWRGGWGLIQFNSRFQQFHMFVLSISLEFNGVNFSIKCFTWNCRAAEIIRTDEKVWDVYVTEHLTATRVTVWLKAWRLTLKVEVNVKLDPDNIDKAQAVGKEQNRSKVDLHRPCVVCTEEHLSYFKTTYGFSHAKKCK